MATELTARRLERGAAAGIVAAIVMIGYAMIASLHHSTGLFTPLYHIASSVTSPTAMMTSMKGAMAGDGVTFIAGAALVGAVIHLLVGAVAGIVFAAMTWLRPLAAAGIVVAGVVYGLLVELVNSVVVLPLTAALFHSGRAVSHMGATAGWETFTVEHVVFGLVLGLLVAVFARRAAHQRPAATMAART